MSQVPPAARAAGLPDLRCPGCGATLGWPAVEDRELACSDCRAVVPVSGGIPRCVAAEHLESFGHQWTRYEVAHPEEDRATFVAKTGLPLDRLRGLRILDAGCGGGRYSRVAAEAGGVVVGADHTHAVDKAARLCAGLPAARFVQADLKHLPFAPGSFDFVFSLGVMHHDVSTRAVFDAVASMVRPGGWYAVWLYRRNQFWQEALNNHLRARAARLPRPRLEQWCEWGAWLGGVPVLNKTLNKLVNFSAHPCRENRVCDTFDWYAPQYQHHHTLAELREWFQAAGFDELRVLPPEKTGWLYRLAYNSNLLIGSGVNMLGRRNPG